MEQRGLLGQWDYSLWYYNGEYMSLYVCPNPQYVQKNWYFWTLKKSLLSREKLTHWKRPWCWERLKVGEEGDDRGWDGWMASLTQWTWVWVNSGSWWWTGRPGVLQSMGSQRAGHDWVTELTDGIYNTKSEPQCKLWTLGDYDALIQVHQL